ncbi:putative Transcriptional regulator,sugar-binding [Phycicoccus elongatus Lp2]|uniref:Putative Transcriptional regulator,sugar-binding n=1 Tax=Phycicoccus elongatus Lp2 TaxID=1193181 RepID=N0E6F7_9MICO|nr:substrate-binding domain-containing protein [Phycicoccus elongatus]CCH71464.1 putative Transcriptional regulator,sugar-binding [Phycicoccus elongatus Lp2]
MTAPRPRRTTLKRVAERAGVSLSTASLVFSGKGPVSEETAARVRTAATALGYRGPDPVASSLRAGRSGVVAVVVESPLTLALRDPYAVQVLDGLADELGRDGLGLLLLAQDPHDLDELGARTATMAMDAAIFPFCGPSTNPLVETLAGRGIPIIGSGAPEDTRVTHVRVDEAAAQGLAVRHLLELGHERIGHITLPLRPHATTTGVQAMEVEHAAYPDARERARGFLALVTGPVVQAAAADVTEGEAAARLLLGLPEDERPTAIVAQSDLLAAGAIRAATSLGLRVPEDLSVTGFDGIDVPWLDQTLTTVDQPGAEKGRRMGAMARAAIGGDAPIATSYDVMLRRGTTSGPPKRLRPRFPSL